MIGEGILSLLDQDKVEKWVLSEKKEALIESVCHQTPLPARFQGGVLPRHLSPHSHPARTVPWAKAGAASYQLWPG